MNLTQLGPKARITRMKPVRRTVLVGFVWLTAATTLLASVPHFDCICRDGALKSFCLGFSTARGDCCCAGSCCLGPSSDKTLSGARDAPPTGQEQKPPCCKNKSRSSTDGASTGSQVQGKCCQKALAYSDVASVALEKTTTKQDLANVFAVPFSDDTLASWGPTAEHVYFSRQHSQAPPPIDLVISLQHFLI